MTCTRSERNGFTACGGVYSSHYHLMQILLLTQIVPYPPDSGPKVKTYHVLRFLAERGHCVTLATFAREHERAHLDALRPYCAAIHAVPLRRSRAADAQAYARSLLTRTPFLVTRDAKREMQALVARLTRAQHFDVVHADQLTMGQFALHAHGAQRVLDAHNAVWAIVERAAQTAQPPLKPLLRLEAQQLKRYEGKLCNQMDAVLAVSDVDRQMLVAAGARTEHIHVIPIAVDSHALQPVSHDATSTNVITLGTLFYPPNADGVRWFLRDVFPLILENHLAVTLTIVGPKPPNDLRQLAARHSPQVTLTGYVPDLTPYLERAALMVVPVRAASGMRVRILEALARGVPVVTTTMGVEGIDAVHGEHLLVADEPQAFARAVAQLLADPSLRQQLAYNGRRLIERRYDWQVVLPTLERVYQSLAPHAEQTREVSETSRVFGQD